MKEYYLSELLELKYGKDHKTLGNGTIPCYGSGGIIRYVNNSLYEKESILIPRKGSLNNLFFINKPFWTVDTLFWSIINEKIVLPRYLFYKLKNLNLSSFNEGSAVPSLTTKTLNKISIKIHDLKLQERIASILSSLDEKIELNRKINQNLEEIAQTLFKRWFIDFEFPNEEGTPYKSSGGKMIESELGEIPEGWCIGELGEIIEFINGYAFKSSTLLKKDDNNCFKVFKMGNIKTGGGLNSEVKNWIKKDLKINLEKFILKKGDILMCMTDMKNNMSLLGHTALMNISDQYILNQRVGLLRMKNTVEIGYPYIYLLTNLPIFLEKLRSTANSGVQVNLSTNEIKKIRLVIPTKKVNKQFNTITKNIFELIFNNELNIEKLIELRDYLLPRLMNGEIDISNLKIFEILNSD